jgi:hypothetical protein
MIQRSENFGLAPESSQPLFVLGERIGQHFDRHVAPELVVRAWYTSPMLPLPMSAAIS